MPTGQETQFTMTITRRIGGGDYVAGKQFAALSRGQAGTPVPWASSHWH